MAFKLKYPSPTKRYIPGHNKPEQTLQLQICRYLDLKWPHVLYKSDFSSGLHLSPYQAKLQKRMMSTRSWPDLEIVQPSRGYHSLFVELKTENTTIYLKTGERKGLLTSDPHIQEQALMLQRLNKLGYFARFGVGYDSCVRLIEWYLNPDYKESENTELF
jgi:hypothetical protein